MKSLNKKTKMLIAKICSIVYLLILVILGLFFPIPTQAGDVIYWVKNPNISFFDNRVIEMANLDRSKDAEMLYGTSAYIIFNNEYVRYIIIQVIRNRIAANYFTKSFREVALDILGPSKENKMLGNIITWNDNNEFLISELSKSSKNAYVHWKKE